MFSPRDLEKLGCSKRVIEHCLAVSKKALEIAGKIKLRVNLEDIEEGALLHDVGRCKTNGIRHAVVGAVLARSLGASDEVARIVERHIGAGITREEAVKLGLPARDYLPKTPEEKIVAYADNLTLGTRYLTFEESLKKYKEIMGDHSPAIKRFIALHEEIQSWASKS
jgi:uncharacterized protein